MTKHFVVIATAIVAGAFLLQLSGSSEWFQEGVKMVVSFYTTDTVQRNVYVAVLLFLEGGYIIPLIKRRLRKILKARAANKAADANN